MVPALSPFAHQANPSASLMIVSWGHFRLAEHHLIEWLPVPTTYSFTQSGAGDESIEPPNLSTYIDADDTPKDLQATVEGISKAKHSGNLVVPRHIRLGSNRPRFQRCSATNVERIEDALRDAHGLVDRAIAEIERGGPQPNFETWFGGYSDYMADKVLRNLDGFKIHLDFSGYIIKCGYQGTTPTEIRKYPLQPQGRHSATDKSLDQSVRRKNSRSANPSGA